MGQRPAGPESVEDDGQQTLGRYRLLRKIARGGMAEVYASRSFGAHGFEKTVAIKRILAKYGDDPQFVRMMVDEAKITVLLNHPNVAQILELGEHDGSYFIVMEFVPGLSLSALRKELVERGSRVPDLEAVFIACELLQGLHAAHIQRDAAGNPAHIIHRDVSPQNVLVSFDGHVKVIDFGIARARHRLELTEVGTIKGKLRYLAPEMIDPGRFMRSGDFDHRVDVFAVGIVLWELIASRTLYQGDDEMAVYDAITDTDAPDLHAMKLCDKDLAKIVKKGLARSPDERFSSAEDFADELRAYLYRRDPKFTHKRVAALMDACFPQEKAAMLALERGIVLEQEGDKKPEAQKAERKADDKKRDDRKPQERARDEKRDEKREAKRDERRDEQREERKAPAPTAAAEPQPVPVDAPTRTHLHSSNSGGQRAAPGPTPDDQPGQVLTVLTLVSRKSQPSQKRPAGSERGEPDEPVRIAADENTRTSEAVARSPLLAAADRDAPDAVDETPHTSDSLRSAVRAIRPARGRMVLLSAAIGVLLAVALVVVLELTSGDDARPLPTPRPPPSAVKLVVRALPVGAMVSVAGRAQPAPAEFAALPGDVLDVVVSAPGFLERSERVQVPRTQQTDLALDVVLAAAPVVDAGPLPAADGARLPVADGGVFDIKAPLPIKDRGFVSNDPPRRKRQPERTVVTDSRLGKLKVTTKPSWALVTIDGKHMGDTPLFIDLPVGRHKLTIIGPSKQAQERTITIRAGEVTTEAFEVK